MSNFGDGDDPLGFGTKKLPNIIKGGGANYHTVPTHGGQRGISEMESLYGSDTNTSVRLVAQIFGKPESEVMKEILAQEPHIHQKTGKRMNFYFPGYKDGVAPSAETFSLEHYIKAMDEMEELTKWKGGLETYLLLMNSVTDAASGTARLDYSGIVAITFERAIEKKTIPSVAGLLTEIMQFADKYEGDDPTWGFSDKKGVDSVGSALVELLLHLLPKWLKGDVEKARQFRIVDVSRPS
jgi:hypothetical protein